MNIAITKSSKRTLLLFLVFWFVWSERSNIGDFFSGLYDGAGGLPSRVQ